MSHQKTPAAVRSTYGLGGLLEAAMENLRQARRLVTDQAGRELLYHAGMTIRTLQQKYDRDEANGE